VRDDSRLKPEFAVHLDGARLQAEEAAAILGIRVFQTRSGASAFEIVVSDPDLAWQGKPTFTECKEVKIELGVPGKLKKIFDGEVTAWRTELERSGPTVLVLRGMDRAHRLMRARKTKTYAGASPIDCAKQIASQHGLTAKVRPGSPAPVKMFRFQANQTDYDFLSSMAELEGYLFWVEGKELHFERPELSDESDMEFSFGEDLKTFLPVANFRKPAVSVEVGAWDVSGKAEITGKAKTGDELWSVPGGEPGAKLAKFTSSKTELSLLESRVATQEHADTVARAALTKRAMEFVTAEVEVQGDPGVRPGAMVNLKKVGAYSGHYLVTEANHFYDGAGYNCIFYVARDKWGDSSREKEKDKSEKGAGKAREETPYRAPKPKAGKRPNEAIDFTLQDDQGTALAGVKVKIHLASGEVIEAETDKDGHVHIDDKPPGSYTVEIPPGVGLTTLSIKVEDPEGNPVSGARGTVTLSDGAEIPVMTDVAGEIQLTDVPEGEYTFKLDDEGSGLEPIPEPKGPGLTTLRFRVEDGEGNPMAGAKGTVTLGDGRQVEVTADGSGEIELKDVPEGDYTFALAGDDEEEAKGAEEAKGPEEGGEPEETKGSEEAKGPAPEEEEAAEAAPAGEEAGADEEKKEDEKKEALLIEVEDAHFRYDSAVFLPEPATDSGADAPPPEAIVGLDVLKTIFLRLKEFPGEKLLVAGHTDTTGPDAYNVPLSEKRAGAVEALLSGDDAAFAKISQAQSKPKDVQQILSWAARKRGWDCDPGKIDGDIGSGTQTALKSFKRHCNEELGTSLQEDAKVDDPFWRAVFALYMSELAKLLDAEVSELDGFRSALAWVDEAKHCVGCGESWPIEESGKDNFRSATNRRVEVLFFEAGQEPKLDCHPAPGKCAKAQCELYPPDGKFKRTPLPVHPSARPQSSPRVLVPEEPGSGKQIAPDGLHAYVVSFKKGTSDLESVNHFVVRGGHFQQPGGSAPSPMDCDREAFFYFSHREDLADDASLRPARFAKDRSGLPLVGPLTVPCGADAELRIDLWQQNDWVLFRARKIDGGGPEAVKMADQRQDYTLGRPLPRVDGKTGFFIFGKPHEKDQQERWNGSQPPIDLLPLGAPAGVPLLVGTLSALPQGKAKLLAFHGVTSDTAAAGTSGPIVVATWNDLSPAGKNVDLAGLHRYDKALVQRLSALKDSDQGNSAVDALPAPPARFFLPGDMNWQDQGQTNNCGAYSFSTAMSYWFPYTNNAGAKNGAFYSDTSRVPDVVNGARSPANVVEAAKKFNLNGVDHDAEELDKARALKLLKLWVSAGVPVLVLVKEDSAAGFFDKLFSYHWKTVVGWDGNKLFMNNSGGDQENDMALRKPGFDYEHGPSGNDMDPIDTHYEKWKLAGGDIVDLVTSVDECTFIPLYPKAAEYAGDRPE
jgi:outer membrane protein OmpA-like peptidoglycan-associated protein/phage protein D